MPSSRDRVRLPRAIGAALGVLALASIPTAGADHNYTEGDIRAMNENTSYCSGDNRFMSCCANAVCSRPAGSCPSRTCLVPLFEEPCRPRALTKGMLCIRPSHAC